ncbi:MAG: hypothetical protein AB8B55_21600 [Mariniblastus sp.]
MQRETSQRSTDEGGKLDSGTAEVAGEFLVGFQASKDAGPPTSRIHSSNQ